MAFLDFLTSPVATVLGSGIAAGASLIGGNKQAEAQREANAQNYKMFQEQLNFTEDMWNKQNAYNTPAEQRKRYEAAGINPYMAMGNISGGNAESVTAPSPNAAAPAVGSGQGIAAAGAALGNGVASLGQSLSLVQQINAQKEAVRAARIENCFRVDKEIANLLHMQRENDAILSKQNLTDVERDNAIKQQQSLDEQLYMLRIQRRYYGRMMKASTEKEEAQVRSVELQNEYQTFVNRAFPALNARQMQLLAAQASQAFESALLARENQNLTKEEAKRVMAQTLGETIQNGIKANEFKLSDFGLNEAELRSLRFGDTLNKKKMKGTLPDMYDVLDNTAFHFVELLGNIFPKF